jgi:DNA-binding Xre family transcriptional regulator
MAKKEIHTGNLIKEQLDKQERSASWLARQIKMEESACRKMLKRKHIDTDRLDDVCDVLNHDFFAQISTIRKTKQEI